MSDTSYYARASVDLRALLAHAVPADEMRRLQTRRPLRHFLVLVRLASMLTAGSAGALLLRPWYAWIPCSALSGVAIFGFTVMLHEVVHNTVLEGAGARARAALGWLYALPSGLSRTQFTRWHLDHHAQLGDARADPKRRHLSPKRNARWLKALYLTPVLFFIYFRGAGREAAEYPPRVRRDIRLERAATLVAHVTLLGALTALAGPDAAFRAYVVPYFFVFPVVFTINRLGQHYDIDPGDPAKWSTLVAPSWFWNFAFVWSGHHLEHHYFSSVPFYNLPALHRALKPFFAERGITPTTYGRLLWGWFAENRIPHTNWTADAAAAPETSWR